MASSDEEELAALRAARRQAMGVHNGGNERGGNGAGAARRSGGGGGDEEESDGGIGASARPSAVDVDDVVDKQEKKQKQPSFRPPPLVLPPSDDEREEADDVDMAAVGLPMSFGGGGGGAGGKKAPVVQTKKRQRDDDGDDGGSVKGREEAKETSSDSSEDSDSDSDDLDLPITRVAPFEPCERSVTCLAVDRSGTRLASGSRDGRVRLFDFGGARDDLRAFRSFFPLLSGSLTSGGGGGGDDDGGTGGDGEGGATPPVVSLCWLPGGGGNEAAGSGGGGGGAALLLVACSDARLTLCDREGRKLAETPRGDSYLADPKNTRGHTAPITCCCCLSNDSSCPSTPTSPTSLVDVASGSEDGTVRIWSVVHNENNEKNPWSLKQKVVIKVPAVGGGSKRTKVTALAFLAATAKRPPPAQNLLVAGTEDGSIHCWDPRSRKGRPAAAGAAVTGPTARLLGTSAKTQDWSFVAGHSASTSRSVAGAHGGEARSSSTSKGPGRDSYVSPSITALAPPPPHLDDGTKIASRGEDGTVKLWDLSEKNKTKKLPLVWSSSSDSSGSLLLPAEEPTTGLAWSPDGRYLATGTSEGTLAIVSSSAEKTGGRHVRSVDVVDRIKKATEATTASSSSSSSSSVSIVPVSWHPRLNQIFVGVSDPSAAAAAAAAAKQQKRSGGGIGGSGSVAGGGVVLGGAATTTTATAAGAAAAGGRVVALFSPKRSERGVLLALSRSSKRKKLRDGVTATGAGASSSRVLSDADIYNPHALPLYRSERKPGVPLAAVGGGSRRKQATTAIDPSTSAAPLPGRGGAGPALGAGSGGRLGASGGTLLTQHVLKARGGFGLVAPSEEGDIRERMLAHGDLSSKDPEMAALTRAYRETQPEKVFQGGKGRDGDGGRDDGGGGDDD